MAIHSSKSDAPHINSNSKSDALQSSNSMATAPAHTRITHAPSVVGDSGVKQMPKNRGPVLQRIDEYLASLKAKEKS